MFNAPPPTLSLRWVTWNPEIEHELNSDLEGRNENDTFYDKIIEIQSLYNFFVFYLSVAVKMQVVLLIRIFSVYWCKIVRNFFNFLIFLKSFDRGENLNFLFVSKGLRPETGISTKDEILT